MDWLNIHSSTIDSEAFRDASRAAQAVWMVLLRYCAGQENGGRVKGAKAWPEQKWLRVAGITAAEAQETTGLFAFDGDDLRVGFYPHEKESQVKHNRKNGKSGGKASGRARASHRASTPAEAPASHGASQSASTEGKGREGKGMEEEGNAHAREAASEIPTEAEFLGAFMADGIPEEFLRAKFLSFDGNNDWLNRHGRLRNWRVLVRGWWAQDRAGWEIEKTPAPNGAGRPMSAGQQLFDLDRELAEVRGRLEQAHALNQPRDAADVARERELEKKRAALQGEPAQVHRAPNNNVKVSEVADET